MRKRFAPVGTGSAPWSGAMALLAPVVTIAFGLASPAPPAAAQGLSLAWHDCRPSAGTGFSNQSFGCGSNTSEFPLFPMFSLDMAVDSVVALELVIDVDVAAEPLPEWWRTDPGQCRANGWAAGPALTSSCVDPWNGLGVASFQGWIPGTPGGSSRHGRLLVTAGVLPAEAVSLAALTPYAAGRVVLRTINSTSCAGCSVPACLVLNSVLVRRLPGSSVEEVLIGVAETPGANFVRWQGGGGADCLSVPARRSTWGAVKALYR